MIPNNQIFRMVNKGFSGLGLSDYHYFETSSLYPNHYNPTHSLDFGIPQRTYYNYHNYNESATIYNRYFKSWIEDRYRPDTLILETEFLLRPTDLNLKNFIFFKDRLWVIDKISGYRPDKLTKVRLISVNQTSSYTTQTPK